MQQEPTPPQTTSHNQRSAISTPAEPPLTVRTSRNSNWKDALSTILILIAAPLVAIFLTAYVFQSYQVDGQSMQNTLQDKDRLIVLKAPRTIARLTGTPYTPNRGDIIVFVEPDLGYFNISGQNKQLIKRVIGLPGDHIVIKDGIITIYNKKHPQGYNPDQNSAWANNFQTTKGDIDLTVKPGQVFVCGDNRNNSLDSRYFGPIDSNNIVGKLALRILPLNQAEVF